MSQFMKNALLWMAIVGMTFFAIQSVYDGPPKENMTYSEFISLVNKDQISTVSFKGDGFTIDGTMNDGSTFTTTRPIYVQDNQLMDDLFAHQVEVLGEQPQSDSIWSQLLVASFPILIILAIFFGSKIVAKFILTLTPESVLLDISRHDSLHHPNFSIALLISP